MEKTIKVVAINTPYQVVINAGQDEGIGMNDKFLVYGIGEMIKDPETGEELEQLEIPRGKGKVIHLQKKICTIESTGISETPTTIKRINRLSSAFSAIMSLYPDTEESEIRREKLPFNEIQVGDFIRKL